MQMDEQIDDKKQIVKRKAFWSRKKTSNSDEAPRKTLNAKAK